MRHGRAWLAVALGLALGGTARAQQRPSESRIFGAPEEKKPEEKKPPEKPEPKPEGKPAEQNPAEPNAAEPKPEDKPAEDKPAEDRPLEQKAPDERTPEQKRSETGEKPPSGPAPPDAARDEAIMGVADHPTRADARGDPGEAGRLAEEAAPEDPLKIGGMFYLRAQTTARKDEAANEWALGAPSLVDAYMDARPNQRVRGLIVGRLAFDPTLPVTAAVPTANDIRPESSGATMGTTELTSLYAGRTRGPAVALDQMWLRFDIQHRVFVTAGKQHVRWGTGRFWTPTDYLHIRKRNPLDVFDARVGTTMVKLHAPWEEQGWNFYAYGLLEDADPTPQLGNVAGAARAEVVLGTAELGAGALVRRGRKPRIGIDASVGVWDIDFYGELALRWGDEIDRVTVSPDPVPPEAILGGLPTIVEAMYPRVYRPGVKSQVVGGATYSRKYNDNDVFNVGVEYFYNPLGYDDHAVYPGLLLPRPVPLMDPATFFYLGRQYGAVFVNFPAPYSWDYTSFTLSTLGNFSDQSFITRLDYALVMLTHLQFEAYAAVRYGNAEGEFRFGINNLQIAGLTFSAPPALFDLGLGLRVNL